LNTLRQTTIGPADTAPTATSARKRLRHNKPLSSVSVVGGQDHIATIALGFSFIERTIAGRLWSVGEKEKANTRHNSKLLSFAKDRGWLTDGEVTALNNLRDVRNYVVHFKDPDSVKTKVRNIFEKQPRSLDFEKDAYAVMQAAIDVLSKTSL
ncbi:MAG: hypothetical protein AB7Q76_22565, partial [Gammaproteobacteria bacterium]